jgi:hypothetical protein
LINGPKKSYRVGPTLKNFHYPGGLDQPIPAGICIKPAVAIIHTQAVNTKGPVNAGSPHVPKNLCKAGITTTEHVTVASMAIKKVWGVSGRNEVSAIITKTWLNP